MVAKGEEYLNEGRWLVVCPEGTRVRHGETRKYGLSGAAISQRNTVRPVIPVAHNAGFFWGRRSLIKKPGKITFSWLGAQFATKHIDVGVNETNKRAAGLD